MEFVVFDQGNDNFDNRAYTEKPGNGGIDYIFFLKIFKMSIFLILLFMMLVSRIIYYCIHFAFFV